MNIFGQIIVVLNSAAVTAELMEKRSSIYSGRARIPIMADKDL